MNAQRGSRNRGWILALLASAASALISIPGWHHDTMIVLSGYSGLLAILAATAFRRGRRLAWVPFLVLPPVSMWVAALGAERGRTFDVVAYSAIAAVALAGLLLSYRDLFTEDQAIEHSIAPVNPRLGSEKR